jgi:NTP pyrophosphatase (non-canonical NTP hydrolase)
MTGHEYQVLASRTINGELFNNPNSLTYHALHGMVGEIGEIHSLYQKIYQGHSIDEEHLKKEVGDLLWFIAEYCTSKDWDLDDVMNLNIEKLKTRYPDGFEVERSVRRQEGDV